MGAFTGCKGELQSSVKKHNLWGTKGPVLGPGRGGRNRNQEGVMRKWTLCMFEEALARAIRAGFLEEGGV